MASSGIDVEVEIDRLYQASLAEFVAARNALAARLKAGGVKDDAARVRALSRPNVPAWAANQVYWTARREFDALVHATRRLQTAQAQGAAAAELREATKERREALAAITARAGSLLAAAGHGATQDTVRRVSDTLEALVAESIRPAGPRVPAGRLVGDLDPPGFEALTQLAQAPSQPAKPDRGPKAGTLREARSAGASSAAERANEAGAPALELARAGLAEAETALERATEEAEEAMRVRSAAESRAQAAREEFDEATRRFQAAREQAVFAGAAEAAAREEATRKAAARDRAEEARDAALRSVRDLE